MGRGLVPLFSEKLGKRSQQWAKAAAEAAAVVAVVAVVAVKAAAVVAVVAVVAKAAVAAREAAGPAVGADSPARPVTHRVGAERMLLQVPAGNHRRFSSLTVS